MPYTFTKVGSIPHVEYLTPGYDDILVVSPEPAYKDNAERARATVTFQQNYARQLGKKCGLVVVMNNLLSQDAASRQVYSQSTPPELYYGVAIVVSNPLARMIGTLTLRFTKVALPTNLVESIEEGIAWLESVRDHKVGQPVS
jgi:hypothetical protein